MTGLPKVTIKYGNGALGQTIPSPDGLLCIIVCGAKPVDDSFVLTTPYSIRSFDEMLKLGINEENNTVIYNTVKDFYSEAQDGTEVYVCGFSQVVMSDILDKTRPYAKAIIEQTNGELRGLVVLSTRPPHSMTYGLDHDVYISLSKAQALGDWAAEIRYAPIFTIIDGASFNGYAGDLRNFKEQKCNRVGVVLGRSDTANLINQAVGLVAGRIAKTSVATHIGRVADGAINVLNLYSKEANQQLESIDVETAHNRGYITFRTFTGKSGYFISDDTLTTSDTDDYSHLTARRTVDKAYRIAYAVLLEKLLDKVPVRSDGTMLATEVAAWQQMVENAIARNMTANGELSDDNGDKGVQCKIDSNQNVLSTGTVKVELRVRPFGYARYIDVLLGFTIV